MRQLFLTGSSLVLFLAFASPALAATWYVAPAAMGTSACDTRACPCSLAAASAGAVAGDTVILMDGTYKEEGLHVMNSGTDAAWITFQADECATPIIEGPGPGPAEDYQNSGVYSATASYVRFIGIVARGWSTGFGNGWTDGVAGSNGHWEIRNCLADGNGRTGFTFFSAEQITIKNSISSHNGSSTMHSWSSGITLYQATGMNVIDGNVSFENTDFERNTDGSGFIADKGSHNAIFVNNLAFGNGGSCFRLTQSSGTKFINNTCYHDARNPAATGPTNPSEIYLTDTVSRNGTTIINNAFVATGTGPGMDPVFGKPTNGWYNNVEAEGSVNYWTAPDGTNPDFTLSSASTLLIGKGAMDAGVPATDLGFDPKCIVKRAPSLVGNIAKAPWWEFDVDLAYIKSIGGVAKCFNPGMRSGTPDIGAYKNGAVTPATPNTCTPAMVGAGGMCANVAGMGGMAGAAGDAGMGGAATAGMGGVPGAGGDPGSGGVLAAGTGGAAGTVAGGGMPGAGGLASSGGAAPVTGGATGIGGAGATAGTGVGTGGAGAVGSGGTTPGVGGATSGGAATSGEEPGGCGCRVAPRSRDAASLAALGLLTLGALLTSRRRRVRG